MPLLLRFSSSFISRELLEASLVSCRRMLQWEASLRKELEFCEHSLCLGTLCLTLMDFLDVTFGPCDADIFLVFLREQKLPGPVTRVMSP